MRIMNTLQGYGRGLLLLYCKLPCKERLSILPRQSHSASQRSDPPLWGCGAVAAARRGAARRGETVLRQVGRASGRAALRRAGCQETGRGEFEKGEITAPFLTTAPGWSKRTSACTR